MRDVWRPLSAAVQLEFASRKPMAVVHVAKSSDIRDGAHSGHWTTPGSPPRRADIGDRPGVRWNALWDVVDAFHQCKDERGLPAWRLELEFDQDGQFHKAVHFPLVDFKSLDEVPRQVGGMLPRWTYLNLRADLIRQFTESQLNEMVPTHVEQARALLGFSSDVAYAKSISEAFYLVMINITADGEIRNGRFDQFFGRFAEAKPSGGATTRRCCSTI